MKANGEIIHVPVLNMHPSQLCIYNELYHEGGAKYRPRKKLILPKSNTNKLKLSDKAKRKLSGAIDYLVTLSEIRKANRYKNYEQFNYRLTFITLTLSSRQQVSDQVLTNGLLHQFLIEAKKKWNLTNYVWRAERQKNLNTHYHIITDVFIPWSELRDMWNRIQNKIGIVDEYRQQMKEFYKHGFKERKELTKHWNLKDQKAAYLKGSKANWSNPNSTDIHSLRNIKDVYSYVTKYMNKPKNREHETVSRKEITTTRNSGQKQPTVSPGALLFLSKAANSARLWSCSHSLSSLKGAKDIVDSRYNDEIDRLRNSKNVRVIDQDYFSVFYFNFKNLKELKCTNLLNLFKEYVNSSGYFSIGKEWQGFCGSS